MKRKLTAALIAALPALALGKTWSCSATASATPASPAGRSKPATSMPTAKCTSFYDEHVAAALGSSLTASGSGGSNYAYSGGVVLGSNSALTAAQPNLALQQQICELHRPRRAP